LLSNVSTCGRYSAGGSALLVSKLYRLKLEQLLEARSATTCVAGGVHSCRIQLTRIAWKRLVSILGAYKVSKTAEARE
jgi:hypothetical protein